MIRLVRSVRVPLLVASVFVAALGVMVMRLGSSQLTTRAAGAPGLPTSAAAEVGLMLLPDTSGCALQPTSVPIKAPDSRTVAQFSNVPTGLSASVAVAFTPCSVPERTLPGSHPIRFNILSEVRYTGTDGTVFVTGARPSATALKDGIALGDDVGRLSDGTTLSSLSGSGTGSLNQVRWLKNGFIITVAGNLPLDTLKDLANGVGLTT